MLMLRHPAAHALSHSNSNPAARSLGKTFANIVAEKHPIAMIKLPIPPLLITAYTAKTTKKKKTSDERRALHKELNRARDRTRVNIGAAFPRWRELRKQKIIKSDTELAIFLLDRYDASASPTKSLPAENRREDDFARQCLDFHEEEEERMSSMEIIVGIDEDDFSHTPDSDIDQVDDGMCSPAEGTEDISEEDVSDDEDYMPSSCVQTDGAITTKRSLNATVQQPPAMDQIQVHRNMSYHQVGNQEKSPAENFNQNKEHFERISPAERPSWPSGTSSVLPSSELGRTPMKMHVNKVGAEVKHRETHRPGTQGKNPSSAPAGQLDSKGPSLRSSEDASEHSPHDSQETQPEEPKPNQGPQTPKKSYVCPTCGKVFSQNQGLKRHLVIHSGKRPFKCFTCGRGFTQSGNLKTHMKVHEDQKKLLASS